MHQYSSYSIVYYSIYSLLTGGTKTSVSIYYNILRVRGKALPFPPVYITDPTYYTIYDVIIIVKRCHTASRYVWSESVGERSN